MIEEDRTKLEQAASAGAEQILALLHSPSPHVIKALLGNSNLTENDILVIANRKNLPSEILVAIARDHRWLESYSIRRALATNPKTPLSVSLSIARYLRLFDLAEISRSPYIPLAFRNKIEFMIMERVPAMALGLKKSLAKMAAGNVLLKLLQDHDMEVIALCLANPRLVEGHLYKTISRRDTIQNTVVMIAEHPKWSFRSLVRFALVRNGQTPLVFSERFLRSMKLLELRDLYADPSLPQGVKPLVHRELFSRGEEPGKGGEEPIYEIDESDDLELENYHDTGNEEC
jgi:hypothetical protein